MDNHWAWYELYFMSDLEAEHADLEDAWFYRVGHCPCGGPLAADGHCINARAYEEMRRNGGV